MYSIRQLSDLLEISYQRCWCLVKHVQPIRSIGDECSTGRMPWIRCECLLQHVNRTGRDPRVLSSVGPVTEGKPQVVGLTPAN
jgi:hypothetical protein